MRMVQLAAQLSKEGRKKEALEVLNKCEKVFPAQQVPYDFFSLGFTPDGSQFLMPQLYHELGRDADARRILVAVAQIQRNTSTGLAHCPRVVLLLTATP